jgi:hypothetical protein
MNSSLPNLNLRQRNIFNLASRCHVVEGYSLLKDELIQIHTFLFHVRTYLEKRVEIRDPLVFSDYDRLGVAPQNVNKSKEDHEHAVLELSKGLINLLQGQQTEQDIAFFNQVL